MNTSTPVTKDPTTSETKKRKALGEATSLAKRTNATATNSKTLTQLMGQVRPLLSQSGQLVRAEYVEDFAKLMKAESEFPRQSYFINILLSTRNLDALSAFAKSSKGMAAVHNWLVTAVRNAEEETPCLLILKLLELLLYIPLDIPALKKTNIGRIMKSLTKSSNEAIRDSALLVSSKIQKLLLVPAESASVVASDSTMSNIMAKEPVMEEMFITQAQDNSPYPVAVIETEPPLSFAVLPPPPPSHTAPPPTHTAPPLTHAAPPPTHTAPPSTRTAPPSTHTAPPAKAPMETVPAQIPQPRSAISAPRPARPRDAPAAMMDVTIKPKKKVRFKPDHELVQVKLFHLEPEDIIATHGRYSNPHEMDVSEVVEIRKRNLEAKALWNLPREVKLKYVIPRGKRSSEVEIQDKREVGILSYSRGGGGGGGDATEGDGEISEELILQVRPESPTTEIPWESEDLEDEFEEESSKGEFNTWNVQAVRDLAQVLEKFPSMNLESLIPSESATSLNWKMPVYYS